MSDYGYTYNRSGGRNSLRLIIAVVIALIGIISYWMKTTVNPVTGEKQRVSLTAAQEMALGLQTAPEMAREMGGAADPQSDPQAALVAEVGRKVVARSDAGK